MKVTFTNAEIEGFLKMIANPKSFRNNVEIKMPFSMDWTLRINIKTLTDRYAILEEARNDLNKSFAENGKLESDGMTVKKEYLKEYITLISQLMSQKNEFDFEPIDKKDLQNPSLAELSMPERDFLMTMTKNEDE